MKRPIASLCLALASTIAHAGIQFECVSIYSSAFAPCSEPTAVFVSDNGPTDTYNIILPNGDVNLITLADATWDAGGTYELVFLDSFSVMELYIYGLDLRTGFPLSRVAYMYGGPDTTGATRDWQALGHWGTVSTVPEPATLALIGLGLLAPWVARRKRA